MRNPRQSPALANGDASRPLAYLSSLCRRWDGELVLVGPARFAREANGRDRHPRGGHTVDVDGRLVIADRTVADPGTVIHEMGHVFLVEAEIDGPLEEPEWLGWEIALARRARCLRAWSRQMSGYYYEGEDWDEMLPERRRYAITERVAHAEYLGIVRRGDPLCTRPA